MSSIIYCNAYLFQEKKLKFQEKVDSMKEKGKEMFKKLDDNRQEMITKWEEKSRELIGNFMELFGREGTLVSRDWHL